MTAEKTFLEYRVQALKLMADSSDQVSTIFENAMRSIIELISSSLDDFMAGPEDSRYTLIEVIRESATEIFKSAETGIDQVARSYMADILLAASDWAQSIGLSAAEMESVIRNMERKLDVTFKNPARENSKYIMDQFESVLLDNVGSPNKADIQHGMWSVLSGR